MYGCYILLQAQNYHEVLHLKGVLQFRKYFHMYYFTFMTIIIIHHFTCVEKNSKGVEKSLSATQYITHFET